MGRMKTPNSAGLLRFLLLLFLAACLGGPAHGWARAQEATRSHVRRTLTAAGSNRYAVIFDAGSSGSRVHVYCFDSMMNLVPVGNDIELFKSIKPGLSSYAGDPAEGANSLNSLLAAAKSVVPTASLADTPIKLGATAGLRSLGSNKSEAILQAVRTLLKSSSFKYDAKSVSILSGSDEGTYLWVTVNYVLGNLRSSYSKTVGVVDLGGGSVQMAYAISEKAARKAPKASDGNEAYVKELTLLGNTYYVYVHSYLNYGLLAARAQILKTVGGLYNPCILNGYHGAYIYSGTTYNVSASISGSNFYECQSSVLQVLNVDAPCAYPKCTFGGVWNGGGGHGRKRLYVVSYFYDKAVEVGIIDSKLYSADAKTIAFKKAAKHVCQLSFAAAKQIYSSINEADLPFLCMDLTYQYTLLKEGFDLEQDQHITLAKKLNYKNYLLEAQWTLGSAIDVISSSSASLSPI